MKMISLFLLLIIVHFFPVHAQSRWQPTEGINGGSISSITSVSEDVLVAGSIKGGLFRTVNQGVEWTSIGAEIDNYAVFALKSKPGGIVFAGTDRGFYKSIDGGAGWRPANAGLPFISRVEDIAIDVDGDVYITYYNQGIFKSEDDGENWSSVNTGIGEQPRIARIEATSQNILIAVGNQTGIYRSTDNGATWTSANSGYDVNSEPTAISSNLVGHIFISTYGRGLYQSSDNGNSWQAITGDIVDQYVFDIAVNAAGDLFAATFSDLYHSTNNGVNWRPVTTGALGGNLYSLLLDAAEHLWIGTARSGIVKSTTTVDDWIILNNGITSNTIASLVKGDSNKLFAAVYLQGAYSSEDDGVSWNRIRISDSQYDETLLCIESIPTGGLIANAGSEGHYISRDYLNWQPFNNGLPGTKISCMTASSEYIFAGTLTGKVYRTPNADAAWADITGSLTINYINDIGIKFGVVYLLCDQGIYRSIDNGDNWTKLNFDASADAPFSIAFHANGDLFVGGNYGIYRSTDSGATWTVTTSLRGGLVLDFHPNGSLYAGTYSSVFVSEDLGVSWRVVGDGLENIRISALEFTDQGEILAGTEGQGLFKAPASPTTVAVEPQQPDLFTLQQNYPNPFNPRTTIEFALPREMFVSLKIYNLLGEVMAVLAGEQRSAGWHQITWDAGEMASGVYFYRLEAENLTASRKLVLMR
ncbi:MAG: T9SS C-terminal target domain-containing protein [Calditrichaeota bacterium]|nr:MAG: T9SS C-terminal target domain-containing protein [Calditrichota bacterium]